MGLTIFLLVGGVFAIVYGLVVWDRSRWDKIVRATRMPVGDPRRFWLGDRITRLLVPPGAVLIGLLLLAAGVANAL